MPKLKTILFVLVLSLILFCGCDMSVNRSIHLRDGEHSGGLNSVNGSIYVGARCRVDGTCRTVNGRIEVSDDAKVLHLDTVNGRILIGARVDVDGDAKTVNGSITCNNGSRIHGRLSTVNGRIELRNAEVDEDLRTVNGDILLLEKSLVRGDILIKGSHGHLFSHRHLEIRLGEGSRIEGSILVYDDDIDVKVFLGKDAGVRGEIKNAQVIKE